jgi:predicted MFS family arabinose efflux permease
MPYRSPYVFTWRSSRKHGTGPGPPATAGAIRSYLVKLVRNNLTAIAEPVAAPPRWLVLLLATATGLSVGNLYYAQPLLAVIEHTFRVGVGAAGAVVTVTQIGYVAGMVLLVPLGDRVQRRELVSVLLLISTAGLAVAGLAPAFWILLAGSLATGVTSVVAQIFIPFAADLSPEPLRGRIVGQVVSGLLIGILLSRSAGSLLADVTSWRVVYLVAAGLMALLAVALRLALPRHPPSTALPYRQLLASTARLVRDHPPLRRRALYQATMFAAFSAFWTTISFVLTSPPFGYSQLAVGLFALVGAGGAVVAPAAGRLADRGLGGRLSGAAFALAALSWALSWAGHHQVVLLCVAAIGLDMAVQASLVFGQHVIYRLDPAARSRVNSVYIATFFLGGAVGSQAGALAYHLAGWGGVCVTGAVFPVLSLAWWATDRRPA